MNENNSVTSERPPAALEKTQLDSQKYKVRNPGAFYA